MFSKCFEWYEKRHDYAREWLAKNDGEVVGCFCSYVPEELIYAAGLLPVRMLGSHEPQDVTEPHIFGMYCPFCRDFFLQVDVTGLSSGESVTGRIEGSLDGVTWDNLAVDDEDTEITENGMKLMKVPDAVPPYVRASGFTTTVEGSEATVALQFHFARMA